MEKYQNLLDQVGRTAGIDLKLEEEGGCAIQLDEIVIHIQFIPEEDQCYFFSSLFPIPENREEKDALYTALLEKNCFYRDTMGGILGIDTGINRVTYATKFSVGAIRAADFIQNLENFINAAEHFVETLGNADMSNGRCADDQPPKPLGPDEFQTMIRI